MTKFCMYVTYRRIQKKHRRCEIMLNRMQASCSLRTRPYIKKAPQVRHYYFWQLSHNLAPCGANIDHCIIRRFRYSTPTVMHISPLRGFIRNSISKLRRRNDSSFSLYLNCKFIRTRNDDKANEAIT